MKVTELRIDNWVNVEKRIGNCQVNGIQLHSSGETYVWVIAEGMECQHRINIEDIKPIPLTVELLEKLCFVCTDEKNNKWSIEVKKGNYIHDVFSHSYSKINLLHQLQNLYFILTGKELEIKL